MKPPRPLARRLFWLAALLLLQAGLALGANPAVLSGTVTRVYDGDTLEVAPHGRVRLLGIDAPERDASGRDRFYRRWEIPPAQLRQVAGEARRFLVREAQGRQVDLSFEGELRDAYGRLLAYVRLPDGRLLNRLLIDQGLASTFRKYSFGRKDEFLRAEDQARRQKLGLWRDPAVH